MTRYEHAYVLNVMSDDHPGIIAAVSTAIDRLGGNIDECSQTVLSGFFTLIMIVSVPEPMDAEALAEEVRCSEGGNGYQVMAREFHDLTATQRTNVEKFVITAFGQDRPGVVLKFSQYLSGRDINIVDLYGDRSDDGFVLISQVEIPVRWDIGMLQMDLEELGREMGFTVRLQHENVFVATNQLRLTLGHRTE